MLGVAMGPPIGRFIDQLIPWYAALIATFMMVVFQAIQTAAGGISIAAVILACFGLDVFRQMQQVSLTSSVFAYVDKVFRNALADDVLLRISASARSRLNAIMIISVCFAAIDLGAILSHSI